MLPPQLRGKLESLDPGSYVAIQNHPRLGANLLEPFTFLREASILIAHHHERWDGSGYPYGLRGEFIPLGARILAIADAFESIPVPDRTSSTRIALRILRVASGTQFDPSVVETLTAIAAQRVSSNLGVPPACSHTRSRETLSWLPVGVFAPFGHPSSHSAQ